MFFLKISLFVPQTFLEGWSNLSRARNEELATRSKQGTALAGHKAALTTPFQAQGTPGVSYVHTTSAACVCEPTSHPTLEWRGRMCACDC